MNMPTLTQIIGATLFGLAVLHTFSARFLNIWPKAPQVLSFTILVVPFDLTEAPPASRDWAVAYIRLVPITC